MGRSPASERAGREAGNVLVRGSLRPLAERVALLHGRLEEFRERLAAADTPGFLLTMREFLEFVRLYDDRDAYAAFERTPHLAQFRSFLAPRVLRFVWAMEDLAFDELMAKRGQRGGRVGPLLGANAWGAYARMGEILELFDIESCRRFLMVGCGPLPDSLFHLHDWTGVEDLVGIERDPRALRRARQLVDAFELHRIRILDAEVCDVDYAGFDAICCSAFVTPRHPIMQRIAATARPGAVVILRDPVFTGTLLFEDVVRSLDPRFEIHAESGAALGRFMLKHYVLRIAPA